MDMTLQELLDEVFQNPEDQKDWMNAPREIIAMSPNEWIAQTGDDTEIKQILLRAIYGVFS